MSIGRKLCNYSAGLKCISDAYSGEVINKIFVLGDIYSDLNDHFHRKIYTRDILKKVDSALRQLN
jgi:hypothetical protein